MKENIKKMSILLMAIVLGTGNVCAQEESDIIMEYSEEAFQEEIVVQEETEISAQETEDFVQETEILIEAAAEDSEKEEEQELGTWEEEAWETETQEVQGTESTELEAGAEIITLQASKADVEKVYAATGKNLSDSAVKSVPTIAAVNGEWQIIGLARSGKLDDAVAQKYLANVILTLQETNGVLHAKKYSEYSRVVLALTSIGVDVTDVAGYDLLQPLADYDKTIWQGVNGAIWALIAFDSHGYEIPQVEDGKTQNSREKLVEHILSQEVSGGGWDLSGESADPDLTAMAIQALAPYYNVNGNVKNAVDRGIFRLSSMQKKNGSYTTYGSETSESCSQVIVALTAMGIDPNTDERFVKNGKSVVDALMSYAGVNGSFLHVSSGKADQMATEQAYYALTAYIRFVKGENRLYDMSDVALQSDKVVAEEKPADSEGNGSGDNIENGAGSNSGNNTSGNKNNSTKKETGGTTKRVNLVSKKTGGTADGKTTSSKTDAEKNQNTEKETEKKEEKTTERTGGTKTEKEVTSLISEINGLFRKTNKAENLPNDPADYTDKQKTQILDIYRSYMSLSGEQKEKVEKSRYYPDYRKAIENLKEYHHFDKSTGTDLRDNDEEILPWYVQVEVNVLTVDSDRAQKVKEALKDQGELFSDMNISLIDLLNNEQWEPQDLIRVAIPLIDLREYENAVIVHMKEDGTMEFLTAHIAGANLEFDTDHFSRFGIAGYHGSMEELMTLQEEDPIWMYFVPGAGAALLWMALLIIRIAGKKKGRKNSER